MILADEREWQPNAFAVCRVAREYWWNPQETTQTHVTRHHLMRIEAGTGEVELDGNRFPLQPGALFVHGPRCHRLFQPAEGATLQLLHLSLGGEAVEPSILWAFEKLPGFIVSGSVPDIDWLCDRLWSVASDDEPDAAPYCDQLVRTLLVAIRRARLRAPGVASPTEALFHRSQRLIRNHCEEISSLEDLARRCHVSPSYLCRIFRQFGSFSPVQSWRRQQMQLAMEWLSEEGLSVKEVAARLRFSDEAAFSKAFKRITGLPPSQYRGNLPSHSGLESAHASDHRID